MEIRITIEKSAAEEYHYDKIAQSTLEIDDGALSSNNLSLLGAKVTAAAAVLIDAGLRASGRNKPSTVVASFIEAITKNRENRGESKDAGETTKDEIEQAEVAERDTPDELAEQARDVPEWANDVPQQADVDLEQTTATAAR